MPIPTGWKDDGKTLTAPNGIPVVMGFRQHILSAPSWNDQPLEIESSHNPLEESNPALGAGSRQTFHNHILEYTAAKGVFEGYAAQELFFVRANRDALQAQIVTLKAQVAALQAAGTRTGTAIPQAVLDDIKSLAALIPPAALTLETRVKDAGLPPLPTP